MTKGELRSRERQRRAAAGLPWHVEAGEDGQPTVARARTSREECRHAARMDRWARRNADRD